MGRPRRYDLQKRLVDILGSPNVYYQPPANVKMSYPCIVYDLGDIETRHANDSLYQHMSRYQVTVITRDPDSELPLRLLQMRYVSFDRTFVVDGLTHTSFILYH